MGTEAMIGAVGSFDPFIHDTCRPHPGQVEVARNIRGLLDDTQLAVKDEDEVHIAEDEGELRQDRYPLRTSAQFLGPQVEDILSALETVTLECNSSEPSFSGTAMY
jgi:phenylalanine ammonia-lyase